MTATMPASLPRERRAPVATHSSSPVRVLIACDHMDFNGALHGGGRQLIELVRALDRSRIAPTVCVLRGPTELGRTLVAEGLPLVFFAHSRYNPASLLRLLRLIRSYRIQVLHLTDFGASTLGRIAGLASGVPSIVQIISHHSEHTHRGFPAHVELAYRALARFTGKALAISESVRRFAIERMGFTGEQVEVLYYPLPQHSLSAPNAGDTGVLRARYGLEPDAPVIGAVTRLFPVKGMRYLVAAFAEIQRQEPRARLMLVGTGPEEEALRAQCDRLGIRDRVIFAGFQRKVEDYVALFRVSVVPSLEEGFGLVAIESMALGKPVVASRIDGLMEIIEDRCSGLLVEPADPHAIAAAVLELLRDQELHRRLSHAGRSVAQRFSLDRYAGRLTELYEQLATASPQAKAG